jgi:hypothetical protein
LPLYVVKERPLLRLPDVPEPKIMFVNQHLNALMSAIPT